MFSPEYEMSVSLESMFPLSRAWVHAHSGHETSAHKKTWSAHKIFLPKMFLHIFITLHSTYRLIEAKCCTKEIFCIHRFKKIRSSIAWDYSRFRGMVKQEVQILQQ